MTVNPIIQVLDKLVRMHKFVLGNSKQKTDIDKEGSVYKRQMKLNKKRKYMQVLEQAEAERKKVVEDWFLQRDLPLNNATITIMLEILENEEEKMELESKTIALTEAITV